MIVQIEKEKMREKKKGNNPAPYLRVEVARYFYACRISKKTTKFVE